jgi:hypothetical protein
MDERELLILASDHLNKITELLKENKHKQYIYGHLNPIYYELQRQLSNFKHG